ncbi:MAG: hypothetical protein PHW10_01175 [Candidatus Peribacteraceae bacterium]|nr:hypothetical protein [Candidatus Peribacteraceae bacterium]
MKHLMLSLALVAGLTGLLFAGGAAFAQLDESSSSSLMDSSVPGGLPETGGGFGATAGR